MEQTPGQVALSFFLGSQKRIWHRLFCRREPASCLQQADMLLIQRLIRLGRHWKAISIFYVIGYRPLLAFLRLSDVTPHIGISCHYFWKKKKSLQRIKCRSNGALLLRNTRYDEKEWTTALDLAIFIRSPVTPLTIYFFFVHCNEWYTYTQSMSCTCAINVLSGKWLMDIRMTWAGREEIQESIIANSIRMV